MQNTVQDTRAIPEQIKRIDETINANYAFIEKCESFAHTNGRHDTFNSDIAAREMEMQELMVRRMTLVNELSVAQYA